MKLFRPQYQKWKSLQVIYVLVYLLKLNGWLQMDIPVFLWSVRRMLIEFFVVQLFKSFIVLFLITFLKLQNSNLIFLDIHSVLDKIKWTVFYYVILHQMVAKFQQFNNNFTNSLKYGSYGSETKRHLSKSLHFLMWMVVNFSCWTLIVVLICR